jgi:hypothetical protein
MSLLQEQFDEYQTTHIIELPTYTSESDIELFWGEMAKLFHILFRKKDSMYFAKWQKHY